MAKKEPKGISLLWKTEDWLAVWVGFLVIAFILAGLTVKTPKFKWTTSKEFSTFIAQTTPAVEGLVKAAAEKKEKALQADAVALQSAIAAMDRKGIGDAAKKMEETSKAVKDEGLKEKSGKVAKDVKGEAGNLLKNVFATENIQWAIFIGLAYLIISVIAMALLGEKAGKIIAGFPVVFLIAWVSQLIAGNYTILNTYGIEFVLWCLFIGLFVSNVIGTPKWLKPAVRTEFYIKSGLVILGANILFGEIVKAGFYGIVQAVLVVGVV